MNEYLQIKEMPKWNGLYWSVTWSGRGTVQIDRHLDVLWNASFKALGKTGYHVGFCFDKGYATTIDCSMYALKHNDDMLLHLVHNYGGVTGMAFAERDQAERCVESLEKVIMWNLLKAQYD